MKGDFSRWTFDPAENDTGVLMQQGRVLADTDVTAITRIASHWRQTMGRDAIGANGVAAPAGASGSFRVTTARSDGSSVSLTLEPGHVWVDGVLLHSPARVPFERDATYLGRPFQAPPVTAATIGAGVRDAVVLEAWEEALSAFQEPVQLLEPALGGPDTTERSRVYCALRLLRVGANDDCATVAARLADELSSRGRLTVTPAPSIFVPGECPLEAGGGYTGLEHHLYRIEIAEPAAGEVRFKWSQFNGGLVGRGVFTATGATTGSVDLRDNAPPINHCGLDAFYLEALTFDSARGHYRVTLTADAALVQPGRLGLTNVQGTWPVAAPNTAFFRLWNGIARVNDFPESATPAELGDGIQLQFQAPAPDFSNYRPGDYWTFPVRAAGTPMDPSLWPANAPPQGVRVHRAPLAIVHWQADRTAQYADGGIDDCRRVFRPLTNQKTCCTYTVGDGQSSHGDFDSIEEAIRHLPATGGQVCLLPGLHQTNAVIRNRVNVRIVGCDTKTKVVPRQATPDAPLFHVADSNGVALEHMDMSTLGGIAVLVEGARAGTVSNVTVAHNRIIACIHAVRAINVERFAIQHNRIRMLDRDDGGVALFVNGDDGLIERNDLAVIPAPEMPPIDNPDDGGGRPVDPVDPCARFGIVYVNRLLFVGYVNLIWGRVFNFLPAAPYRAPGGIQLAGGCERVRVLENSIRGGAGNGVTLGTTPETGQAPGGGQPEQEERRVTAVSNVIMGQVAPPSGVSPVGIQLAFVSVATGATLSAVTGADGSFGVNAANGSYRVTVATPGLAISDIVVYNFAATRFHALVLEAVEVPAEPPGFGFLYDIAIEKNRITGMGLSGIGVPPAVRAAAGAATGLNDSRATALQAYLQLLGTPVIGLLIEGNLIHRCLRNPFDAALAAEANARGLGGVSLGFCQDTVIRENRIEECGTRHVDPVCGIFVTYGESVDVTLNHIRHNGPRVASIADLSPGRRGGIVLNLVAAFPLLDVLTGTGHAGASPLPAARIHENEVDQPAGLALHVGAMGPLMVTDNAFASEISGARNLERMAGTVLIFNLGGIQFRSQAGSFMAGTDFTAGIAAAGPGVAAADAATGAPAGNFARAEAAASMLPAGSTQFCDNQSSTGRSASSLSGHLIVVMDDLDYSHNQTRNLQAARLFSNGLLFGTTLRATGNRLSESNPDARLSMMSVASRLNATTYNQGDHCFIVSGTDPAYPEVQDGNMVIDNRFCRDLNMAAEVELKPRLMSANNPGNEAFRADLHNLVDTVQVETVASLSQAREIQLATRVLMELEAARLLRKVAAGAPQVETLRAQAAGRVDRVHAIEVEAQIAAVRVPRVEAADVLLHGRVTDQSLDRVAGVAVQLLDTRGEALQGVDAVRTDAQGYYAFVIRPELAQALADEKLSVGVASDDQQIRPVQGELTLVPGRTVVHELRLSEAELSRLGLRPTRRAGFEERARAESPATTSTPLEHVRGIGPVRAKQLRDAGIPDLEALLRTPMSTLVRIKGFNVDVVKEEAERVLKEREAARKPAGGARGTKK
jgi:hypothetical protein